MHRFFTLLFLLLFGSLLRGQDVHFSQFYHVEAWQNPAELGLFNGQHRATAIYRSQWQSVPVPYLTFGASYEGQLLPLRLENDVWGWGMQLVHDQAGDANLSLSYLQMGTAYTKRLSKNHFVGLGGQMAIAQRRLELDALRFDDQFNGDVLVPNQVSADLANITNTSFYFVDVAFGMHWRWQRSARQYSQVGLGLWHPHQPIQRFMGEGIGLATRYSLTGRWSFPIQDRLDAQPSLLLQQQGPYRELVLSQNWRYHLNFNKGRETALLLGTGYRWGDALIALVGLEYQGWRAALSYDINISGFAVATNRNGGIELSLQHIWRTVEPLPEQKICPIL